MKNPYCKIFDEGRLADLKSIISQDTKLACLGAESLFEDLSVFLSIGITYGSHGFIEIIGKAIDEIHEADDAPTEFLSMLASIWVQVGHHRFNEENYAVTKLADVLLDSSKLDQELRSTVKAFFIIRNERELFDAVYISILDKLRSGVNAIPEFQEALQEFYESNQEDGNIVYGYWNEALSYEFIEILENKDLIWHEGLLQLILTIAQWDPHFICIVISIDADLEDSHLTAEDLGALSIEEPCDDNECEGPRAMVAQHPNFR
jgi:hypothetical protein